MFPTLHSPHMQGCGFSLPANVLCLPYSIKTASKCNSEFVDGMRLKITAVSAIVDPFTYFEAACPRSTNFLTFYCHFRSAMEHPTDSKMTGLDNGFPNTPLRNHELDGVLDKLKNLSGCTGVEADDVSHLIKELDKVNDPLQKILTAKAPINSSDKARIDGEWAVLRNMTEFVAKELEERRACPQANAPPSSVWSKVCFTKALYRAEKLYILVDSSLKYPPYAYHRSAASLGCINSIITQ